MAPNASIELKKKVISDDTSSYELYAGYSLNPSKRTMRKYYTKAIQLQ